MDSKLSIIFLFFALTLRGQILTPILFGNGSPGSSFVQIGATATAASTNGNTIASASIGNIATATMCVAYVSTFSNSAVVTDNCGNTYTSVANFTSGSNRAEIFRTTGAFNACANEFFQFAGTSIFPAGFGQCWKGPTVLDQNTGGPSAGAQSSVATGSITPTGTPSLVISGAINCNNNPGTMSVTPNLSLDAQLNNVAGQHCAGAMGHTVQNIPSAINVTWSWTDALSTMAGAIASFK
jgi:hypothetical protein